MITKWHAADPIPPGTIVIDLDAGFDPINHPGVDRAACTIGGRLFTATSQVGSIHALCRILRDAGIPDAPWIVPGRIKGASIHWMADHTVTEASGNARTGLYHPGPGKRAGAQKGGSGPEGVG